ncbi:MAG TPA: Fic family protein [Solirubrobacteraceae bacterium]|jgi:death-on-curing protein|nr:Fic family protein [Solirubrobacteraceae bacterium]
MEIDEFLLAAEAVLGMDADRLARVTKIPGAESALAAPFASFDGHDFYEQPVQRAAVLASRIMRNHPLPDGNKRVALILMELYLENEGLHLTAAPVDIDHVFRAVAGRAMDETDFCAWLAAHTEPRKA